MAPQAELTRILSDHGLTSPRSVGLKLERFGRDHLKELLTDLSNVQKTVPEPSAGLSFLAGGGRLGLGSGERAAKALTLVADRVLLPFDLPTERLLQELEKVSSTKAYEEYKAHLGVELHPFLFQYLRIQPLIEAGLVELSPPLLKVWDLRHPLAARLKGEFLRWVEYGIGESTKGPWMQMKIGPTPYSAFKGIRSMGSGIVHGHAPLNLESRDEFVWDEMRPDGRFEPRQPEELLDPSHPLADALDEFVSIELFRMQVLVDASTRLGAYVATDSVDDWDVLSILTGHDEQGEQLQVAGTLAEDLGTSLPFFDRIGMEDLARLRLENESAFDAFRAVILQAARAIAAEPDPVKRREKARLTILEEIKPRFAEYTAHVEAAANSRSLNLAASGLAMSSLAAMVLLVGPDLLTASASGALSKGAIDFLSKVLTEQKALDLARGDPMFFLWRLQEASRSKGTILV